MGWFDWLLDSKGSLQQLLAQASHVLLTARAIVESMAYVLMYIQFTPISGNYLFGRGADFEEMTRDTLAYDEAYATSLSEPLAKAGDIGEADIVVGIPFHNEWDTIGNVCQTVVLALLQFFPDNKCLLVCAGGKEGEQALQVVQEVRLRRTMQRIAFLMKDDLVSNKVWTVRAIMEIADRLHADLALFEADLKSRHARIEIEGLAPEWVMRLLFPISKGGMDLVIPRFNRHYLDTPGSAHLVRPLLASIFNIKAPSLPGGILGVSSKLVRTYLDNSSIWSDQVGELGLDIRLITTAVTNAANICEASLGVKLNGDYLDKELVWRQQIREVFEAVVAGRGWWQREWDIIRPLAVFGGRKDHQPDEVTIEPEKLIARFKESFNEFEGLYQEVVSREAFIHLRKLRGTDPKHFKFPPDRWAEIVFDFLLAYCLEQEYNKDNILDAFVPICYAREAAFAQELGVFKERLTSAAPEQADHLVAPMAESVIEQNTDVFIKKRADFLARWSEKEKALKPLLPRVTYREFIPGFPLVAPKELVSPAAEIISVDSIYEGILRRHREEFEEFLREGLQLGREATSHEIIQSLKQLMLKAEKDISELLLPGDLATMDGTMNVAQAILQNLPHSEVFALKPEVTAWLLERNPPNNLLIRFGATSLPDLSGKYSPSDILALASLSEEEAHTARVWDWIAGNARPEHFTHLSIAPLVESHDDFPMLDQLGEPSHLVKLAGRIVISNLREGAGGEFPKLRYSLTIAKNIVEAESIGEIWEQFAQERKEFGARVINSLKGHWGKDPLSAHNIFENKLQKKVIQHFREMISDLEKAGDPSLLHLTKNLSYLADCYHLALFLADGTFIPCSTWTWSSYSFKGGKGLPKPLSLHVERDWASREFLVEMLKAIGGSEEYMDRKITELMGRGMESENLARLILPGWEAVEGVMPEQLPRPAEPEAGKLSRFKGNPILKAMAIHPWESKYVFNPGAIKLDGKIHILYRACGEDEVSRIGLAVSSDGYHIEERLESPIFEPVEKWESRGCEDPRLVLIGERIYMLYTAYDGVTAQIELASIDVEDFLGRRWSGWMRHGLMFPGSENKDATLFPETFQGRYVMYHRIEPSIWISSSECLDCPWPGEDHRILLGPGAGMAWDGFKIGGGSQPIKTKHGWLLIYHGVDQSWIYRLGVLLVALDDPGRLLYRSPNAILEPEETYELGEEGCYVPNVVFTCGAVPSADKEVLEDEDEVLVYYGAADTAACVATAKVSDLIPGQIRHDINHGFWW